MNIPQTIGSIAAMIFTAGSMLAMWVFAAASLANASPDSVQRVKMWVINLSLYCLAGIGVGIRLLVQKRCGWSTCISLLPAATMLLILLWRVYR
jgi:hypothetical protein